MIHDLDISLDDLHLFYQVVNNGGFLRAAQTMNICQGKASRRIQHLENMMGTRLLYRNMRDIALTPAGKKIFKMAQDVLECATQTFTSVKTEQQEMVGEITLSVTVGFGSFWLMPVIGEFTSLYPDVSINIARSDPPNADVMMGEADITIASSKAPFRETLEQEQLCRYPCYIYASEAYLQRKGAPQTIQDLDHHSIVAWKEPGAPCEKDFNTLLYCGRGKDDPRKPSISIANDLNIVSAVASGLGLGWMPTFLGEALSGVRRIDFPEWPILAGDNRNEKYLIYTKNLKESKKHRELIELIKQKAQSLIE